MTPLPNPFENFNSAALDLPSSPADTVAAIDRPAPEAATVTNSEDMPEPFSVYAHRRSMPIISPPLNAERIGLSAVRAALNIHPRDLDLDPAPLFLRSPSKPFLNALFSIAFAPDRGERPDRSGNHTSNESKFKHRSSPRLMTG